MAEPERTYNKQEPSTSELVVRGVLIIICAFIAANVILVLHQPMGH